MSQVSVKRTCPVPPTPTADAAAAGRAAGGCIVRIHVKDYSAKRAIPAAEGNARVKLLEGDTNWPAVMKALDNVGYTGWATSEQTGNQAADVETARDLAQRMDRIIAL